MGRVTCFWVELIRSCESTSGVYRRQHMGSVGVEFMCAWGQKDSCSVTNSEASPQNYMS